MKQSILIFLVFFISVTCENNSIEANQNLMLYRETVSNFTVLNSFNTLDLASYYKQCLASKKEMTCVAGLINEVIISTREMFTPIFNAGGGLHPEAFYLLGDIDSTLSSKIIIDGGFIEQIVMLQNKIQKTDCAHNKEEAQLLQETARLLGVMRNVFERGINNDIALGNLFFEGLMLESSFLFTGIKLCQM